MGVLISYNHSLQMGVLFNESKFPTTIFSIVCKLLVIYKYLHETEISAALMKVLSPTTRSGLALRDSG